MEARAKDINQWQGYMSTVDPDSYQECLGLLQGLGVEELKFFAVHFLELLGRKPIEKMKSSSTLQCTVVAQRNPQGLPLVAKTDDVGKSELGMNVMEITFPDEGYPHLQFHYAGTIWTVAGMNQPGLSIGMTGIPSPTIRREGISSLTALHTILPRCTDVREAIEHIRGLKINSGGFSLILGDAKGELALVERTAVGTIVFTEDKGPLVHANEILDQEFAAKNPPSGEAITLNSRNRCSNAQRQLENGQHVDRIMTSRGVQGAIFQEGQNEMYTDIATVFSPVEKKFKLWTDNPDGNEPEIVDAARILAEAEAEAPEASPGR